MLLPVDDTLELPDELGSVAKAINARFEEQYPGENAAAELGRRLMPAMLASEFCTNVVLAQWPDIRTSLQQALDVGDALDALSVALETAGDDEVLVRRLLRRCRHRVMAQLLVDELCGDRETTDTLDGLSRLADTMIGLATRVARQRVSGRFGTLRDPHGKAIPLVVVGMGKLGGGELNFSSDIDLVFLYPRDGESDGRRQAGAQEYCLRWSQQVVSLLDEATTDGFVFRVDTRLRPFGDSGPPVCSFQAFEEYLLKHGRSWERYAWMKARICGEDPGDDVRHELMDDLVCPFVYRRYVDYGLLASLREMHQRIDAEKRGLGANVKLGSGGIREIEFIAQSLQMLRGGAHPELQTRSLMRALAVLRGSAEMPEADADALSEAYLFLRKLENLLQARRDRQTHDLPDDGADQAAIAFAMGYPDWEALSGDIDLHRGRVAEQFGRIAYREGEEESASDESLAGLWEAAASGEGLSRALADHRDGDQIARSLTAFRSQLERQRPGIDAEERVATLLPALVELAETQPEPAVVVDRCLSVVQQVLRRSAYIALLNENPATLRRLCELGGRSRYIIEQIAAHPALLDELLDPRALQSTPTRESLDADSDEYLTGIPPDDAEALTEALARFQRISMFRIALADTSGNLPLMKASDALSWLAEVVLDRALAIAWTDMCARHGEPRCEVDGDVRTAGFGIVAYGKLGGLELSYGSDLDLVFLHDSTGERQQTDGAQSIDNSMFFARLVRRLMHILTTRTRSGVLYEIDTRLRPSGRSGLMVTSVDAFERYQREEAWTWEHQALLRARPVGGSQRVSDAFGEVRARVLTQNVRLESLANDVVSMRSRMRRELDRSTGDRFDLKQGKGGIGDIEFIVQYLALSVAADHPGAIEWSDNIRQLDALAADGVVESETAVRLQDIYREYRRLVHQRVLNAEDRIVDADALQEERRFVSDTWNRVFAGFDGMDAGDD